MIDDPDIYRAAKLLIDQHGIDAATRAAQRCDELADEGDMDGAIVWRRILAAIDELQRVRRDGEPNSNARWLRQREDISRGGTDRNDDDRQIEIAAVEHVLLLSLYGKAAVEVGESWALR
jgi:hypothetical protein